jgi:hypothetical protein
MNRQANRSRARRFFFFLLEEVSVSDKEEELALEVLSLEVLALERTSLKPTLRRVF